MVADAVGRATHLPLSQVVLHDGLTLAAEKPQEPYSALSLTTALVRRDPTQFYETTSSGYPTLVDGSGASSSGNTSAPNTERQISREELFSAPTRRTTDLHRPVRPTYKAIPCYHLRSSDSIPSPTSRRQLRRTPQRAPPAAPRAAKWERLRAGYAHDPAFKSPCAKYRFDKHLQVYFLDHRLVVPDHDDLRKQILLWYREHPWHAHLGIKRTHALITDAFYWSKISQDIKDFVAESYSCQTMKSPGITATALSPLPVPSACWRIISLDAITQLPKTTSDMDCIIVFVDQFSKMVRLIPAVSTLHGPGFAKLFFRHIYPHYGLPLGVCSDRGVQWNNAFFRSVCSHMGIQLHLTFSYHPRANS